MAVFTAIASAIVTAIGVSTATIIGTVTWASLATSVIATGLAIGTAKLLGVFEPPRAAQGKDPGVKIQLAPSTDNKIPRFYGRNFAGGMIIDAEIKNQNKTMAYAIVISEYNDDDDWSINDIYRGDAKLVFGTNTSPGAGDAPWIVQSVIDPNATASNKVTGKLRCRVWAGGASAAHQIFPATNAADAWATTGDGYCQFKNWTSANTMEGLVFAIFEIDYEPEEGLTGLGAITFDINNNLTNPADVMLDYLKNDRYGAQLTDADLDLPSFNDWRNHCDVNIDYITQANVTSQHTRLQIDGAVSTFNSVKQNINDICLSGGAFFTYNNKTGKFGVVVNRAATVGELANAFVIDNDNIVSSLTFRSTDLFSLYNRIEVEYPSVNHRDQTDIYIADVDPSLLNPNEPENTLKYRIPHVNDRTRVATLANIDINQSRLNTVIELTTDHSGIQVDVGDVVKLTEPLYGYTERLFRCMRTTELEDSEGTLTVKMVLLEYDSDVYGDLITQEDLDPLDTRIVNWWVENSNTTLNIGDITIVNDPDSNIANIHSPITGNVISTANITTVRNQLGSMFSGEGVFINVPIDIPANTTFNQAKVVCINTTSANAQPAVFVQSPATAYSGNASYFENQTTFNFGIDGYSFTKDTSFKMDISLEDTVSGSASRRFVTGTFQVSKTNTIRPTDMSRGSSGIFRSESLPAYEVDSANVTSVPSLPDPNTWKWLILYSDNYWVAPVDSVTPAILGDTYPYVINNWLHTSRCIFTGRTTSGNVNTTAYRVNIIVSYSGNVVADNALVENTDYVLSDSDYPTTDEANCAQMRNLPVYVEDDPNFFGQAGSILIYRDSAVNVNVPVQPITTYNPFTVYPKAYSVLIQADAVTSIQAQYLPPVIQQRGFGVFQSLQATNRSAISPDERFKEVDFWYEANGC